MLESLGETQQALYETGLTVDPHQLKGIELNPRAAAITDLVLWIGYLQVVLPHLGRFHNIEHRDALLDFDKAEPAVDEHGNARTTWDGTTKKRHPVTREEVPDDAARRPVLTYVNARRAEWPKADFIIGNPPFLGNWRMRGAEAIRLVYREVPETADYVMYWWRRAGSA